MSGPPGIITASGVRLIHSGIFEPTAFKLNEHTHKTPNLASSNHIS